MAWYSLLPSHLTVYETWVIRICLFLAVLNLSPWLLAIFYDLVLWICRSVWHEVPLVGGRAQGRIRPRRPGLAAVAAGNGRRMSLSGMIAGTGIDRAQTRTQREEQEQQERGGTIGEVKRREYHTDGVHEREGM